MIKAFGFCFKADFTTFLNFLSAFSVTEQVLITYIAAFSSKATRSKPSVVKFREIVAVSEKLSLHPNV